MFHLTDLMEKAAITHQTWCTANQDFIVSEGSCSEGLRISGLVMLFCIFAFVAPLIWGLVCWRLCWGLLIGERRGKHQRHLSPFFNSVLSQLWSLTLTPTPRFIKLPQPFDLGSLSSRKPLAFVLIYLPLYRCAVLCGKME